MAGQARIDASWERVDQHQDPEGAGWELVEDTEELVVLDVSHAEQSAKMEINMEPGTNVTLTVGPDDSRKALETDAPLLKVDRTVLQGAWDELLGSEIVLQEGRCAGNTVPIEGETMPTYAPLAHGSRPEAPPTGASSTTSQRITFVPVREAEELPIDTESTDVPRISPPRTPPTHGPT